VSCAETAEPIDLSFGLWSRVGQAKHKFNRIRQVAPMCAISIVYVRNFNCIHLWRQCAHMGGDIGASWRIHLNRPSAAAMPSYVKLL